MATRVLCVLLFLAWTAERNSDPQIFNGIWRSPLSVFSPLFDSISAVHQPAWNLLLLATTPLCYFHPAAFRKRAWPMDAAIGLGLATLAFGFLRGVARGGSAYWSYYQLNGLVLALLTAFLLVGAVRSSSDLRALGTTVLAAAVVRAGLALYFFFQFVFGREPYPPHMTSHDDSPLFVAGILVAVAWALVRRRWQTWLPMVSAVVLILLAVKVNNRRLAWIEMLFAFGFFLVVLPPSGWRRRIWRGLVALAPVVALYVAVGWGRRGFLFAPLRAFDSTTVSQNQDPSALARLEENLNLVLTFIQHPILGSGWGHEFVMVSSYYANFGGGFDEMYRYTPHNSLTALVAFGGLVGLFGVLGVMPIAAFLGARAAREARLPTEQAAAMVAVSVLPVYGVHAFGDLGFQGFGPSLLMGAALAAAARASAFTGAWGGRARRRLRPSAPIAADVP